MVKYIRVKVIEGANKGAHMDVPEKKADNPRYERLDKFPPSNFPRRTKFPADFKKKGEEEALSVTVAEGKADSSVETKKPVEGNKKEG